MAGLLGSAGSGGGGANALGGDARRKHGERKRLVLLSAGVWRGCETKPLMGALRTRRNYRWCSAHVVGLFRLSIKRVIWSKHRRYRLNLSDWFG